MSLSLETRNLAQKIQNLFAWLCQEMLSNKVNNYNRYQVEDIFMKPLGKLGYLFAFKEEEKNLNLYF